MGIKIGEILFDGVTVVGDIELLGDDEMEELGAITREMGPDHDQSESATEVGKMLENASANNTRTDGTGVGPSGKNAAKSAGKIRGRSAATTGRRVFVEGDGNSRWARRYRDLIAAHCRDMGGADLLSEAQRSLIKRASAIELELEQMEGKLSLGQPVDLDVFTRSASHLRRLWETLGLKRQPRDVTTIDDGGGGEIEVFSPMRSRWAAEATEVAKQEVE